MNSSSFSLATSPTNPVAPRSHLLSGLVLACAFLASLTGSRADDERESPWIRVAVKLDSPATDEILARMRGRGQVHESMGRINILDMHVRRERLAELRLDPRVRYVEEERVEKVTPSTSASHSSELLSGLSDWNLDAINVTDSYPNAFLRTTNPRIVSETGKGIYVALLDTGLRPDGKRFSTRNPSVPTSPGRFSIHSTSGRAYPPQLPLRECPRSG